MDTQLKTGFVVQPRLQFDDLRDDMMYQLFMKKANYIESSDCKIGELITSITALSKGTGWGYGVVRGIITRLEDSGLITVETLSQKRGIKITIVNYSHFQSLKNYEKNNKENNKPRTNQEQRGNKEDNKGEKLCKSSVPKGTEQQISCDNKEKNNQITNQEQTNDKENRNTITAYITSFNSINNRTLKHYVDSADVKSFNLTSTNDITIFVDFALRNNVFPTGTSRKILINYFDCIRMTRQTCNISAKLLANLIDKLTKYTANQINYALWTHFEKHDDKRENYTLGILRGTDEHQARQGLIKLRNSYGGVVTDASNKAVGEYDYGF